MRSNRRHACALVAVAIGAALLLAVPVAAPAATRPPPGVVPPYIDQTVVGPHFVIHYTDNGAAHPDDAIPAADAATLANEAEDAYGRYGGWGYPPPLDDGDGKTDVYVFDTQVGPVAWSDDFDADQSSGALLLTPAAHNRYALAHELFHLIQFAIYRPHDFFSESSAEWAGQAVVAANGGAPPPNWYPFPDVSLDCIVSCVGESGVGTSGGYHGSIFWQYLSERFGMDVANAAYERNAVLGAADHAGHDLTALDDVLRARGSSLTDAFNGYARAAVAGEITRPGVLPNVPDESLELPYLSTPTTDRTHEVSVDHLALKVVSIYGYASRSEPCEPETMKLSVELPAAAGSRPVYVTYPASGPRGASHAQPPADAVYPLEIAGAVASAEIPWSLCADTFGALALPNASTNADGQPFAIRITRSTVEPAPLDSPRLTAERTQDVDKLSVRVRVGEKVELGGKAAVRLTRKGRPVKSRTASGDATPKKPARLRLRFAKKELRKIKKAIAAGKRPKAKITVTAISGERKATAQKTVKLKD